MNKSLVCATALLAIAGAPSLGVASQRLSGYGLIMYHNVTDKDSFRFARRDGFQLGLGSFLPGGTSQYLGAVELGFINLERSGNRIQNWSATYLGRVALDPASGLYAGYGAGLDYRRVRATVGGGGGGGGKVRGTSSTIVTANGVRLSGAILLGFNLSPQAFTEVRYRFSGDVGGVNVNGLQFVLGFKF